MGTIKAISVSHRIGRRPRNWAVASAYPAGMEITRPITIAAPVYHTEFHPQMSICPSLKLMRWSQACR